MILAAMLLCVAATGCGAKVKEQWAYSHEPEVAVLTFYDDGTAEFHDKEYKSYEITDTTIRLTKKNDEVLELKYYQGSDNRRFIYEKYTYSYTYGDNNSQLIGVWESGTLSFEFTEKGTFLEDGNFAGHYTVQDNGTIHLAYDAPIEDIELYYSLANGKLYIEYPWPYVQCENAQ